MSRITCLFIAFSLCLQAQVPSGTSSRFQGDLLLDGTGRRERMALDREARRIYIPDATGVVVTDLEGRRVGAVAGARGVNSVALAPELGLGIFSNDRSNTLSLFNLNSLAVEKELRTTGAGPAAVVFDPAMRRIFAFNQRGRNATAFDAFGGAVAGTIALGGTPGAAVVDGLGHIFVSLKDTREVLLLDTWKLVVLCRLPVAAVEEVSGLALDPGRKRLFVVGANEVLAILDSGTGRQIDTLPIGAGPVAVECDPGTGSVRISHRGGGITVLSPCSSGEYKISGGVSGRRLAPLAGAGSYKR